MILINTLFYVSALENHSKISMPMALRRPTIKEMFNYIEPSGSYVFDHRIPVVHYVYDYLMGPKVY